MNRTINDLTTTLADALGIERDVVSGHANALREAKLFPGDDDRAEPEHVARMLISLMYGAPSADAAKTVTLFEKLPLDCAHRGMKADDGRWSSRRLPEDDPDMDILRSCGESFLTFLTALISLFNEAPETDFAVECITVGGGTGTVTALVYYKAFSEEVDISGSVKFSLAPYDAGYRPDDAPPARIERVSVVPGTIFPILRKMFTGNEDGPRKVFRSRADLAHLSQELV